MVRQKIKPSREPRGLLLFGLRFLVRLSSSSSEPAGDVGPKFNSRSRTPCAADAEKGSDCCLELPLQANLDDG